MRLWLAKHVKRGILRRFSLSARGVLAAARQIIDDEWYFSKYPSAAKSGLSAFDHYMKFGAKQNNDPCLFFWTQWYLEHNPDVAQLRINPFLHYLQHGGREGRNPSPLFDSKWYSDSYLSPEAQPVNPLLHYYLTGQAQGLITRPDLAIEAHRNGALQRTMAPLDHIRTIAQKVQLSGKTMFYHSPLQSCFSWLMARGEPVNEITTSLGAAIAREMDEVKLFARAPYHCYLNDATILPGCSTIIASDGTLLNDEITFVHERFGSSEMKLFDSNWLHNNDLLLKYTVELTPTLESGIHLFKEYEQNYFHFIFEIALKLYLIEREELVPPHIPLLIPNDLDGRLYDMISLLKHPDRRAIHLKRNVPYRVNRLFYMSDVSRIVDAYEGVPDESFTFMSPTLVADFARYVKEELGEDKNTIRRRLFLMRSSERRGLVNQRDVVDAILGEDFEAASLELLSLAGQVKVMSEASVVIGATGAAFANLVWCAPGTQVLILYPDHPLNNRTFWNRIGQAIGLQITYLDGERQGRHVGKYGMHDDFKIDVDIFDSSVRGLISGNA
ncbi:glycosyltransferase family 61 protein [Pseudochelatococcus sp. G4_1912]|uniref:glycosyltransferase family 61 protein n=1 Tax=Pseudochelatococcus sp. G4_1912 TaxID=3114288 RepID=UPI0039C65644